MWWLQSHQITFMLGTHDSVFTRGGRCLPRQDSLCATTLKTGVDWSFPSEQPWVLHLAGSKELMVLLCGRCLDKRANVLFTIQHEVSTWTAISMYNEAVTNHPQWEKHHLWCYWKQSEYDSHTDLPSAAGLIKFKSSILVQTIIIDHGFHWSILMNCPRWLHITTIQHVYSLLVNYFVGLGGDEGSQMEQTLRTRVSQLDDACYSLSDFIKSWFIKLFCTLNLKKKVHW